MAGELFPRMAPGDPFSGFSAGAWNRLMQLGEHLTAGGAGADQADTPGPQSLPGVVLFVRNDSGVDCDRFAVLGVDAPVSFCFGSEIGFKVVFQSETLSPGQYLDFDNFFLTQS